MLIDASTGNVGINDLTPTEAKLVVNGVGATGSFAPGEFFNNNSGPQLVTGGTGSGGWCIYANGGGIVATGDIVTVSNIRAVTSFTPSDIRLKNIVGRSDPTKDLDTLEKIEITDYTMKDTSVVGTGTLKKVIAQQVEKVYPRAVSKTTDYLPDILASGKCTLKNESDKGIFEIHSDSDLDLKIGDRVKLFNEKGEADFAIVQTAGRNVFTAKLNRIHDGEKVFVYGRQVDDLRIVDYDAISMLNVSATQELAKKGEELEKKVAALEAENDRLRVQADRLATRTEALENENLNLRSANEKLAGMSSEIEVLKKAVANMQPRDKGDIHDIVLNNHGLGQNH